MRKIIQILESKDAKGNADYMTALCNDGTVWFYVAESWEIMEDKIPQDGFRGSEPDFIADPLSIK